MIPIFKWLGVAQDVYREYLSKPYSSPSIPSDWEYIHSGVTIPRPNHGLLHTLRTASYVSYVVYAYNFFHQPSLTARDIDHLQLALLFYVTGRENEAAFGNPDYLRFRQKSADAFERYIRQKLPNQFTEQQLQFYKQGIYDAYSSSPPQYVILRICHDLDLLRCYPRSDYDKKIQSAKTYLGTFAEPLSHLAEECLEQTGDRIMGKQSYNGPLFTLCSTNIQETLQRIDQVLQKHQGTFMQPVQPTQPLPPGLKAPVPKTPWNISPGLFTRIQSQPEDPFARCEVLPTDPEAAFVLQLFMHSKPHNYAIKKIHCIHNPDQTQSFEGGVKIIEREADNPAFTPKGKTEPPQQERAHVLQRWQASTASFSPVKIKGPKRTDKYTEVKVLPLWHGSNAQKCQSICTSGFTSFGKHHYFNAAAGQGDNNSTDIGYFGSGIYFTDSARYAAMYANGHLLLSWVSMREPYPVVNDIPHPSQGSDMKKLKGHGHYQNYNAHYIPVASIKPLKPDCMEYYPCHGNQIPAWDEIVVFDNKQTLPRFWIELGLDAPAHPFASPYAMPVSVNPAPANAKPAAVKMTAAVPASAPKTAPVQSAVIQAPPKAKAKIPAMAFGVSEWKKYIGDVGTEPPLPADIEQILSANCPFWKGKKVHETHLLVLIPQTVNGKPLNLKLLGELVEKPLQGHATKYSYFNLGEYTDPSAPKSHWALLTHDVIVGSRDKSYHVEQLSLIKAKAPYEVPTSLDASVCIFMEHIRTGAKHYSDNPMTFTRCQEKFDAKWQLNVGGFSADGLYFNNPYCYWDASEGVGIGGLRKF
jgi:hypothetical protein